MPDREDIARLVSKNHLEIVKTIAELVKKYPNDQDLGKAIRKFVEEKRVR